MTASLINELINYYKKKSYHPKLPPSDQSFKLQTTIVLIFQPKAQLHLIHCPKNGLAALEYCVPVQ